MHKLDFYLLYFGLAVDIGKTYFFVVTGFTSLSTPFKRKRMLLMLLSAFLLSIMLISVNGPYLYFVNAFISANSFAMQSQLGAIVNNCASNFSIQTQSSNNGKTGTANKSTCNDESSLSSSSSSSGILSDKRDNLTLAGTIVSSEYDQKDGVIVNSVYGNWSLTLENDYPIDFKSSFTLQPILYGYNNVSSPKTFNDGVVLPGVSNNTTVSAAPHLDRTQKQHSNTTLFSLSNFNVYSVQQQNSDNTYSGYVDVVQDVHFYDLKKPDQTKIYKRTGVSISIMDHNVLFINFDKDSHLFDEFKNIPLVGLVRSDQK